jgi:hypothetical protein
MVHAISPVAIAVADPAAVVSCTAIAAGRGDARRALLALRWRAAVAARHIPAAFRATNMPCRGSEPG